MPGAAVTATPEQWEEVARRVQERRVALGLNQEDLGASRSVVSNLESNRQEKYARSSLTKIAQALGWTPDSIERILDGGEPALIKDVWYPQDPTYGEPETSLDKKLADLDRRLTRVERFIRPPDDEAGIPPRYRDLLADLRADGRDDEAEALIEYWRERRGPPPAEQAS